MASKFQGSSFQMENMKNCPICQFNPPSNTKGSGYLFWGILQKSLIIGQFACMQIFKTLALKWRICKINPICQFNPHQHQWR